MGLFYQNQNALQYFIQNEYLFIVKRPSWTFLVAKYSLEKWFTSVRELTNKNKEI